MAAFATPTVEIVYESITPILNYNIQSYGSFQGSKNTVSNLDVFDSNNKYVKLFNSFKKDIVEMKAELNVYDSASLSLRVGRNLAGFLELNPSSIRIEVSYENSFIITFKKGKLTFFIEQYFDYDNDNVLANIYKDNLHFEFFDCSYESFLYSMKDVLALNS